MRADYLGHVPVLKIDAKRVHSASFLLVLTLLAFLVLGYHPYAEDGGIYAAAVAGRLDPSLFAHDRGWVAGHTRLALFVPAVAICLRVTHIPLPVGLLMLQVLAIFTTLWAVLDVARLCFAAEATARWATVLFAVGAGLPVAGTSLYLVDPYVTARSFTTALLPMAAASVLRRRWVLAGGLWVAAALLHPLMAAWGLVPLLTLAVGDGRGRVLAVPAVTLAGLGLIGWAAAPDAPVVHTLAMTRAYWFISAWRWYEVVGAVVPVAMLGWLWYGSRGWTREGRALARAACVAAVTGLVAALMFAHLDGRSCAVARLQPLRTLHFFYGVFLVLAGGSVAEACRFRGRTWVLGGLAAGVAIAMAQGQRAIYPASGWAELPWAEPRNGWEQAFLWVRDHTATDALFGLDARYTEAPGEDAQGFRAVALRSVVPDAAKDAGIAAVVPALAAEWEAGSTAQAGLDAATDAERARRLRRFGVSWIVLRAESATGLECPYRNGEAKVCRLR